jgi:hypothetical protein
VAEHLAWLQAPGGDADPDLRSLGRLFSAARAAHFLESTVAGEPELDLTAAAVARRIAEVPDAGTTLAEQALGELRLARLEGAVPAAATFASLRASVARLPAYADGARAEPPLRG